MCPTAFSCSVPIFSTSIGSKWTRHSGDRAWPSIHEHQRNDPHEKPKCSWLSLPPAQSRCACDFGSCKTQKSTVGMEIKTRMCRREVWPIDRIG
jgi:hypothetical protein